MQHAALPHLLMKLMLDASQKSSFSARLLPGSEVALYVSHSNLGAGRPGGLGGGRRGRGKVVCVTPQTFGGGGQRGQGG